MWDVHLFTSEQPDRWIYSQVQEKDLKGYSTDLNMYLTITEGKLHRLRNFKNNRVISALGWEFNLAISPVR